MTGSSVVTRVVGACLRDARERRMMWPEQSADALGITVLALLALEEGTRRATPHDFDVLTGLYRCPGTPALRRLLDQPPDTHGVLNDREPGHARRLGACVASAGHIRWQSTTLLPGPLQTPHYALAVAEPPANRPGAPQPPARSAQYVLDQRIIQRGSKTARLMAGQLHHLLQLADTGTDIRIIPGTGPLTQPAGHLIELHLPGGTVWARPTEGAVAYSTSALFADTITASLARTSTAGTREALKRAASAHHDAPAERTTL
ncbi:Scr1 family TA system antitoxin-like transcriptional regulator [Streptomyces californicus]|uniref:Scr1 family TA system antitoxin-like transcriptional regulator n=1 Tax=Streptomyces californicus TaxID=67351 RepID=UPI0037880D93